MVLHTLDGDVGGCLGALSQLEPQTSKILYNRAALTLAQGNTRDAEKVIPIEGDPFLANERSDD